jgi:hypothetical protein
MTKKIPVTVTMVAADQVWAAAAAADRINDGFYYKETQYNQDETIKFEPNRVVLRRTLNENSATDADRELGAAARAWHRGQLLMTALKRPLSEFEDTISQCATIDEFALEVNQLEIAVVASQIRSYRTGAAHEQRMWGTDTSPMAAVGTKVECQVEVTKSVYSQNYNTNYVRAVTVDTRKVVMFTYREGWDVGTVLTIRGTVKAHREDCTQLNRVKVL